MKNSRFRFTKRTCMQKILLAFSFAIFFTNAKAQWVPQPKPLHKKDFTTIAAKKYTMAFEYKLEDGANRLASVVEYDAQGLPAALYIKGTNDNGDSATIEETIYKFDGIGRLIKESNSDIEEGESWDKVYYYSKNDRLIKTASIHIDPATTTYTYDGKGKVIKTYTTVRMAAVDEAGNATAKTIDVPNERKTFTYDKAGRLTEETVYYLRNEDGDKKWSYKTRRTYNAKNQLVKFERINEEGAVYTTETYEYNADGLLTKRTEKRDDEPLETFVYEYCTNCKQSWLQ